VLDPIDDTPDDELLPEEPTVEDPIEDLLAGGAGLASCGCGLPASQPGTGASMLLLLLSLASIGSRRRTPPRV
jgi:hypothetical protein